MITKGDIITVKVPDKLIFDAVLYAEKSLHFTFNRMGKSDPYDRVRNIVKGLIMEGAFKLLLDEHHVNYDLLGNTHWTKKDRYDVGINGHKYDIKGFYIGDGTKAAAIAKDPSWLLDCCALVPADQVNGASLKSDDVYVFPFITGEVEKPIGQDLFNSKQFRYIIHAFWDYAWINKGGSSLGKLTIQSKMNHLFHLRIGGQGADGELVTEDFAIKPNSTVITTHEFSSVLFVQTGEIASNELVVTAKKGTLVEKIVSSNWGNIWVYNSLVYFTGMITKKDFRDKTVEIPRFYKKCKQYSETQTVNRMMLIQDLNPLSDILQ